jgi:hypothetical protein
MKTKKIILLASGVILLLAYAAGCTSTTNNNSSPGATVSNSPAPPDVNAGSPDVSAGTPAVTTASSSPAPVAPPGTFAPPNVSTMPGQPAPAVGKAPERVIGSGGNDFFLFSKIRGQISQDEQLKNANIIVNINGGTVTLTGTVANPEQKARAEQLAHGVEGVKSIKNQLRVVAGNSKG